MGVNNKQRRAAKQRKRARQRPSGGPAAGARPQDEFPGSNTEDAYALAQLSVTSTVRRIGRRTLDDAGLRAHADALVRRTQPIPRYVVESALADLLADLIERVLLGGWGPVDLTELVRRCADARHVPTLAAVLHDDARRHQRYAPDWLAALEAVGPEARLQLDSADGLASGLRVAALLAVVPLMDADATSPGPVAEPGAEEHPKLARVRALLAKAESTDFDEEAEALSAKAQELISRYALDRLLAQTRHQERGDGPRSRRIWLDAPYVRAKAALVAAVASANRCRTAVAETFGFSLLIGAPADLDAVELLSTSLLVQANTAMLRHGRRVDRGGASRTRSFRQSFLLAYAGRIGERLRAATTQAEAGSDTQRLLPVLRDHEARVTAAFEAMVPHTVSKATTISNGEGWAAGQAAADLALLDVNGKLPARAG